MGDIISLDAFREEPALEDMDRKQLLGLLDRTREQLAELDRREPEDPESEDYDSWGEAHEDLEDLADEIMDLLDELGDEDD